MAFRYKYNPLQRFSRDIYNDSPGGSSTVEETVDSLFEVLLPTLIRNQEIDNMNTAGTRWTITNIDTVNKKITLDNDLPYLHGLNNRDSVFDYWGLYKNYYQLAKIESADYENKIITYSTTVGSFSVGNTVNFFNPFRKMRMLSTSPLINTSYSWCSAYVQPSGMWKHSDGTYRMLVNGYNGSIMKVGIASSSDLTTWSFSPLPIFELGVAPFNKAWMGSSILHSVSNPAKIPGTDNLYYLLLAIKNTSNLYESVFLIVDEDMNIIKMQENPVSIPGHANTHGNQPGGVIFHDGVFKVFIINRAASISDWTVYECEMGDPITNIINYVTFVAKGSASNTWLGSHTDATGLIIYKDKLYVFVAGTGSRSYSSEVYYGNRTYGLYTKENGVWTDYPGSPVISPPIEGETIWGSELLWATDHIGGYFANIIEDNYLYVFTSMNNGSNTYKVAGMKFDLRK